VRAGEPGIGIGGKVLGKAARLPGAGLLFLAAGSGIETKIIGLANAGLLVFITDVHARGLKTAQGLIFTEAWYWDANDANRAFANEFGAAS
jgi:hypothetical protein